MKTKIKVTLTKGEFEVLEEVLSAIDPDYFTTTEEVATLSYLQDMFSYSHYSKFAEFGMISDEDRYGFEIVEEN